jgi:alkylation response protein AidB-like acyl-CoA dehydrogenase
LRSGSLTNTAAPLCPSASPPSSAGNGLRASDLTLNNVRVGSDALLGEADRALPLIELAVGQQAVQLHGGMGMSDELAVGHYFKRLTMIEALFGNTDHQLRRFAAP